MQRSQPVTRMQRTPVATAKAVNGGKIAAAILASGVIATIISLALRVLL